MCLDCGCVLASGNPALADDDHGDPNHITLSDLMAAANASGVSPMDAVAMIGATLAALTDESDVAKGAPEQRFVLGVAYQAGRDPRIAKGLDGARDYFEPAELEKACWSFMLSGQQSGLFHLDGTTGHAQPVENGIYRNPIPWIAGPGLVVRKGDWTQGYLLDDVAWPLVKDGKVTGLSPQGLARRRRRTRAGTATAEGG